MNRPSVMLDGAFADLVDEDVFTPDKVDPELAVELRDPEVASRWYQALVAKKLKLQNSAAALRANWVSDRLSLAEYKTRHAKLVFGLGRVDVRLVEAKELARQRRGRAFSSKELLDRAEALLQELAPGDPRVTAWRADRAC